MRGSADCVEVNRILIFRWKEAHEEIHVDVKCSAEEIEVTLKGVIPHEIFQLKDPSCRLSPAGRYTQSIQVKKLTHVKFCLALNSGRSDNLTKRKKMIQILWNSTKILN